MTTYSSVNAANFVTANLGVQTHFGHPVYGNVSAVASAMKYIGFDNIRDAPSVSEWQPLASQGMHFNAQAATQWGMTLSDFHSRIDQVESAHPGSIVSVEGP